MGEFTISIDIDVPATTAFAYIADATRTPEWYEAVRSASKVSEGATGVGTRYRFVRELPQQGEVVNEVELAELDPPHVVAFESRSGPTPFVYRYLVEDRGPRSQVTLEGEISGEGLRGPVGLLAPVAARLFESGMKKNLSVLKSRLENP